MGWGVGEERWRRQVVPEPSVYVLYQTQARRWPGGGQEVARMVIVVYCRSSVGSDQWCLIILVSVV